MRRVLRCGARPDDFEFLRSVWAKGLDNALLSNATYIDQRRRNNELMIGHTHHLVGQVILVPPGNEVPTKLWDGLDRIQSHPLPAPICSHEDWAMAELLVPIIRDDEGERLRIKHHTQPRPARWLVNFLPYDSSHWTEDDGTTYSPYPPSL